MIAKLNAATIHGIHAIPVTVEVCVTKGVGYHITGLPDESIKESLSRVSIALQQCGYTMPRTKLVIHLSPAGVRKSGTAFDLPIALGILLASGQLHDVGKLSGFLLAGEIGLDARINQVAGVICMSELAAQMKYAGLICPLANAPEAALVPGTDIYPVSHLHDLVSFLSTDFHSSYVRSTSPPTLGDSYTIDLSHIVGQQRLKRSIEVAAAGGHHLLMQGFPGSGKSLIAKCLPSILPPMNEQEMLETTKIRSVMPGYRLSQQLITERPFCETHSSISELGLFGGSSRALPGQVTAAHNGVLFMDEFSEFSSKILESLRQPLEERRITVARSKSVVEYPAAFMLIAAMNPCACGYHRHPTIKCSCSPRSLWWHHRKISGPILDRFDLCVEADPVEVEDIFQPAAGNETSEEVRQRIIRARKVQEDRLHDHTHIHTNAQLTHDLIAQYCKLQGHAKSFLQRSWDKYGFSMRSLDKTLKVARTIADLAGSKEIDLPHLAEALSYRFPLPLLKQPVKSIHASNTSGMRESL